MLKANSRKEAIDILGYLVSIFPDAPQVFDSLAFAYLSMNEPKKAQITFQKALALNADFDSDEALEVNLFQDGVTLIKTVSKNMKAKDMSLWDRAMLSKRFIIETINDQSKNISFIEHSRHYIVFNKIIRLNRSELHKCFRSIEKAVNTVPNIKTKQL